MNALRRIRKALGLRQVDLAKRWQVTSRTIQNWEKIAPPPIAMDALQFISIEKRNAEEKPGNV